MKRVVSISDESLEQIRQIIERNEKEYSAEDDEAGERGEVLHRGADGGALEFLDEEKEELPAVENRNGEEVQDGEIHTDDRKEHEEFGKPLF